MKSPTGAGLRAAAGRARPRRAGTSSSPRARLTWTKLIRRVYEVDPLLCPFCGAEMKILAFILDFGTARAIRKSLTGYREVAGSGQW